MSNNNSSGGFASLWFVMFVVIKVAGTALTDWSWWWIFFPIVPDIVFVLNKLGWL